MKRKLTVAVKRRLIIHIGLALIWLCGIPLWVRLIEWAVK